MKLRPNKEKLYLVTDFLDSINYRMICSCILKIAQLSGDCCFPDFRVANSVIKNINPMYGFIFAFFRMGHCANTYFIEQFLPKKVFETLLSSEMLIKNEDTYQMNNLAILPLGDLYLLSSLPTNYPTAILGINSTPTCFFSADHQFLLSNMPERTSGKYASELFGTHGAFGIWCARNYTATVIYPLSDAYIPIIQSNIFLNRLEHKISIASQPDIENHSENHKYDFICASFPSVSDIFYMSEPIYSNNNVLMELYQRSFENYITRLLSESGQFYCMFQSFGDQYSIWFNDACLKPWQSQKKLELKVHVLHKELFSGILNKLVEETKTEWEKEFGLISEKIKQKIETLTKSIIINDKQMYGYTQLLEGRNFGSPLFWLCPVYNPEKTDLLYQYSQMLNY